MGKGIGDRNNYKVRIRTAFEQQSGAGCLTALWHEYDPLPVPLSDEPRDGFCLSPGVQRIRMKADDFNLRWSRQAVCMIASQRDHGDPRISRTGQLKGHFCPPLAGIPPKGYHSIGMGWLIGRRPDEQSCRRSKNDNESCATDDDEALKRPWGSPVLRHSRKVAESEMIRLEADIHR